MRLGQLARKLSLRPAEIVNFLAENSILIDSGNNTRLENEHVTLILQKYAPGELVENLEKAIEEEETAEEPAPFQAEQPVEIIEPVTESDQITEEKIELIKAPKVELSGLKVLGKIELPETKKKEPATDTSKIGEQRMERKSRTSGQQRRERSNKPVKNPVAVQREQEALEEEQRRKEKLERDKEKKTLHYMRKVNTAQPIKAVRAREEKEVVKQETTAPAPTSLWGRFRRWLNS